MSESGAKHTTAERVTLVISVLILATILAIAGWSYSDQGANPARINVETHLDQVRVEQSGYYLPLTVTNTGGLTAQDVVVSGELVIGNQPPEEAEITITFLAGGESEKAYLIFQEDPSVGDVSVVITSYLEP